LTVEFEGEESVDSSPFFIDSSCLKSGSRTIFYNLKTKNKEIIGAGGFFQPSWLISPFGLILKFEGEEVYNEKSRILAMRAVRVRGTKFEQVEYYAGGSGQERPLSIYRDGERQLIEKVISRKRIMDSRTGRLKEVFECELAGGEKIEIEREFEQNQNSQKG